MNEAYVALINKGMKRTSPEPSASAVSEPPVGGGSLTPSVAPGNMRQVQTGSGHLRLAQRSQAILLQREDMETENEFFSV